MPTNFSDAETLTAETVVVYSDHVAVPADVRANLCVAAACDDHGDGGRSCPIPETWGGLRAWANDDAEYSIARPPGRQHTPHAFSGLRRLR